MPKPKTRRRPTPAPRCHYCGARTTVTDRQVAGQGPLARLPHSPIGARWRPLCAETQRTMAVNAAVRQWAATAGPHAVAALPDDPTNPLA